MQESSEYSSTRELEKKNKRKEILFNNIELYVKYLFLKKSGIKVGSLNELIKYYED